MSENNLNTTQSTDNVQNINENPTNVITQAPVPKRIRRVGTFTMGVALVAIGLALCAAFVLPSQDMLVLAKFAPLVLVALGIEILISSFFYKNDKIKYDGLSIFICFILIFGSVCASLIPVVFSYLGPAKYAAERNIATGIEDAMFKQKSNLPGIVDIRINVNLMPLKQFTGKETLNDIDLTDTIYAFVNFSDSYPDKTAFAADAIKVLTEMEKITKNRSLQLNIVSKSEGNKPYYELDFYGRFTKENDLQTITKAVNEFVYDEELKGFVSTTDKREINNIYETAQQEANEIRSRAQEEANDLLEQTQNDAEELRKAAQEQAEQIRESAQDEAENIRNQNT